MITGSTRRRSRFVSVVLTAFGAYSVLLGLFMMLAPAAFFDTVGAFGTRNDHYIFDNASFELPLGLLLLAALRWSNWRIPALAFAVAHWGLHALSHLIDTGHADGRLVGVLEFAGLALGTVVLAAAVVAATRNKREVDHAGIDRGRGDPGDRPADSAAHPEALGRPR
jgi:peptidoglycan/LPS O-acetylase OafA/YrhL